MKKFTNETILFIKSRLYDIAAGVLFLVIAFVIWGVFSVNNIELFEGDIYFVLTILLMIFLIVLLNFEPWKSRGPDFTYFILFILFVANLVFTVPYIFNLIITTKSHFGFINTTNENAWIGFYGSVFGGMITLLGVILTFLYQSIFRKEELIYKIKINGPLLSIDKEESSARNEHILNSNEIDTCFNVYFINNGESLLTNVTLLSNFKNTANCAYAVKLSNLGEATCFHPKDKLYISVNFKAMNTNEFDEKQTIEIQYKDKFNNIFKSTIYFDISYKNEYFSAKATNIINVFYKFAK